MMRLLKYILILVAFMVSQAAMTGLMLYAGVEWVNVDRWPFWVGGVIFAAIYSMVIAPVGYGIIQAMCRRLLADTELSPDGATARKRVRTVADKS